MRELGAVIFTVYVPHGSAVFPTQKAGWGRCPTLLERFKNRDWLGVGFVDDTPPLLQGDPAACAVLLGLRDDTSPQVQSIVREGMEAIRKAKQATTLGPDEILRGKAAP